VAKHRLRDRDGVDDVVGALDAQFELVGSHRMATIEHDGFALERDAFPMRRCRGLRHPLASAAPRGCASTKRAKTTIRFAAL
jgi:hypothetical protein